MGGYPNLNPQFSPFMNPIFILMVCVGCFFLLVPLVANVDFNAAVGGDSPPAPWMRRFRRCEMVGGFVWLLAQESGGQDGLGCCTSAVLGPGTGENPC
jgi:hypothetical protein